MEPKCVDGHPMIKGKKFCGACGKGAAEPAQEMVKCASCSAELLKAQNFCDDCGSPAPSQDDNYDEALDVMTEFSKARHEIEERLAVRPEVDLDAVSAEVAPRVAEILKGTSGGAADGQEPSEYDAMPIIEELFKSVSAQSIEGRVFTDHTLKYLGHMSEGQAVLMKATLAIGAKLRNVEQRLDTFGNQPRGRKGVTALAVADKPLPGGAFGPMNGRNDLRGQELLSKCSILPVSDGGLNSTEISQLEQHTMLGHGLPEIAASDRPVLAQRCAQVLNRIDAVSH